MNFETPGQSFESTKESQANHQEEREESSVEQEGSFQPSFDDAVEAYYDAPIFGESVEGFAKIGEHKFRWGRNNVVVQVTPDKVHIFNDDFIDSPEIEGFIKAQQFAREIQELWGQLPPVAQSRKNLQALGLASQLKEYSRRA